MFIGKNFIYLQLQKTGGTHIVNILNQVTEGEIIGRHNRLPKKLQGSDKIILGSIRDPWDWYVSLWAYGCDGNGELFHRLTSKPRFFGHGYKRHLFSAILSFIFDSNRQHIDWMQLYRSSKDPTLFRKWLSLIQDPKNRFYLGECYGGSSISHYYGFLTYRYAYLYSRVYKPLFTSQTKTSDLTDQYLDHNNIVDYFIRNEHLEEDLIKILNYCGIENIRLSKQKPYNLQRSNESSRARSVCQYYDNETVEIINVREKYIIQKFGYKPPEL